MNKSTPSDLTARARIRNAALALLGEYGIRATSIRKIARAAGVSPGLVQHHFRTKRALENEAAGYVRAKMAELAQVEPGSGRARGTLTLGAPVVEFISDNPDVVAYVRRVILEDSPTGRSLLDSMLALSRSLNEQLRQHSLLRDDLDAQWTI